MTERLHNLESWMRQFDSVMTAYSGGVDSALVMAAAHRVLGERAVACIGSSPSYPERELEGALKAAAEVGARVRVVVCEEHLDPRYAANPANRCYFCKSELYTRLKEIAEAEGIAVIVDGNNATDAQAGDRPGWLAGRERGIRSPLAELGITKEEVRALAKEVGLGVWDKPAAPCLASRVPHGLPIVPGLLQRIERAENVLHGLGFREFRVRHHQDIARIELPVEDFARAVEMHRQISAGLKAAEGGGYKFVTLDL
ncbi:MAG TPA: ATP-dependent sacrificial sulfur transferase LarE, partial [Phycisphaerae bacterium]|nr:ATP-dependent sacrificial sulfur transferase LarE [Phycisphaerae bacterium]